MGRLMTVVVLLVAVAASSNAQPSDGARELADKISAALKNASPVESGNGYLVRPSQGIMIGGFAMSHPSPQTLAASSKVEVQAGWYRGKPLYVLVHASGSGGRSGLDIRNNLKNLSLMGASDLPAGMRSCATQVVCEGDGCSRWSCQEYSVLNHIAVLVNAGEVYQVEGEQSVYFREPPVLESVRSSGLTRNVLFQIGTLGGGSVYVKVAVREDPESQEVSKAFMAALDDLGPLINRDERFQKCTNGRECVQKCEKGCCKYRCK